MKIRQAREKSLKQRLSKLVISLIVPLLTGLIGAVFTASAIPGWYSTLAKPSFNPPNWVFGPVWTILYLLMGIALFLVWNSSSDRKRVNKAITVFVLQLFLNLFWTLIFFGLKMPGAAFAEILLLWASVLWTMLLFRQISRPAFYFLIPYLAWVSFAAVLNLFIWLLNR